MDNTMYCAINSLQVTTYSVSQKNIPLKFSAQAVGNFCPNFTCLLYIPIYDRLHIFIQLSATLTKL